mmetsp:Transcript_40788/g.102657  ORF Transcript_40788/g.102657 Transcript_40788/m.102657 type:complete len:241 (+) Transcript_40788:523-1245(+)
MIQADGELGLVAVALGDWRRDHTLEHKRETILAVVLFDPLGHIVFALTTSGRNDSLQLFAHCFGFLRNLFWIGNTPVGTHRIHDRTLDFFGGPTTFVRLTEHWIHVLTFATHRGERSAHVGNTTCQRFLALGVLIPAEFLLGCSLGRCIGPHHTSKLLARRLLDAVHRAEVDAGTLHHLLDRLAIVVLGHVRDVAGDSLLRIDVRISGGGSLRAAALHWRRTRCGLFSCRSVRRTWSSGC